MKKVFVVLLAVLLAACPTLAVAQSPHYDWLFLVYDLGMAISIGDEYTVTGQDSLADVNAFEKSGNVKADLVLDVYSDVNNNQMFISAMQDSPYDNVEQLMEAYLEDLGMSQSHGNTGDSSWEAYVDQEFMGIPCARIISTFDNVHAEYMLFLCEDHCAYIFTMITFNDQPVNSQLEGVTFTLVPELKGSLAAPMSETVAPAQ